MLGIAGRSSRVWGAGWPGCSMGILTLAAQFVFGHVQGKESCQDCWFCGKGFYGIKIRLCFR